MRRILFRNTMTDIISKEKRSWVMSRVRSKDTTPEKIVRSYLFSRGLRFRLYSKKLPGHPDVVLPKYKAVIEVRGCFWHRHPGCKIASTPKTNVAFWQAKFDRNVARDARNEAAVRALGWRYFVVWECELSKKADREKTLESLYDRIVGIEPPVEGVPMAAESKAEYKA